MQTVKQIILDINTDYKQTIEAKQGDTLSRYLEITLNDNGVTCNLINNTVKIYIVKPDKTVIFNSVTVEDPANGLIKVELTSQMLAVVGDLQCELCIYGSDNSLLSSKAFIISVIPCLHQDSAVQSQNEFTALTEALAKIAALINFETELSNARQGKIDLLTNLQNKDSQISAINTLIAIIQTQICPVGLVAPFASAAPPSGWLECNGSAISRTTYSTLFAAVGTTYGVGDGSTTFNLPESRGEFIRGWDNGRGVDPGRFLGSHQGDAFASHTHTFNITPTFYGSWAAGSNHVLTDQHNTDAPLTMQPTGGSETRPKNVALMFCIKY